MSELTAKKKKPTVLLPTLDAKAIERSLEHTLSQRSDGSRRAAGLRASAVTIRNQLEQRWARTQAADEARTDRRVNYLSMEFLMGRTLGNALVALNGSEAMSTALDKAGMELADVLEEEQDAALGNGGLGRLAACFLDSMATVGVASFGYGLRYQHGMFSQRIEDGRQIEMPDMWLKHGNPWESFRPELAFTIGFGGRVEVAGGVRRWVPAQTVNACAHDLIVPGRDTDRVSTLRLWKATASSSLDFAAFSRGDILGSAQHYLSADSLNWLLYPDDSTEAGRELRLRQEFMLVSASLQDMIARHLYEKIDVETFGLHNAVHLNDTHPAMVPAELMRLLIDEHGIAWEAAWKITRQAVSYTNHTLMPEALETWPVAMMERILPRHLEIIYEINQRFLTEVAERFGADHELARKLSLVDESGERRVRMAHLAIVASHKINGVSALHSDLMVKTIFADFARLWPQRFINVTNGVTLGRWVMHANPHLTQWLDATIGKKWRKQSTQLETLRAHAKKPEAHSGFTAAKLANKQRLVDLIRRDLGISVDPHSLFDVQVKRIHEYKRQLLNLMHVVARYQAIIANPQGHLNAETGKLTTWVPRTVVFSGKAASAYVAAKQIIRLIHDVARVVNSDPRVGDKLKVVYLPDYSVSLAEKIIPAADLSEQVSTAGTEASGTGNMKFALNGALTIGTWDGANIEMAQAIGEANVFVFGLRTDEVAATKLAGYDPRLHYEENKVLQGVVDAISGGVFCPGDPDRYRAMMQQLLRNDPYLLLADFESYCQAQAKVDVLYKDQNAWVEKAILNVAGMGGFSSDRTIAQYVDQVWAKPGAAG